MEHDSDRVQCLAHMQRLEDASELMTINLCSQEDTHSDAKPGPCRGIEKSMLEKCLRHTSHNKSVAT